MVHNTSVSEEHQKAVEEFLLKFVERKKAKRMTTAEQIAMATTIVRMFNAPGKNT